MEKCKKCKFWFLYDSDASLGSCKRYPPIYVETEEHKAATIDIYWFPSTWAKQWCGEFKPKK